MRENGVRKPQIHVTSFMNVPLLTKKNIIALSNFKMVLYLLSFVFVRIFLIKVPKVKYTFPMIRFPWFSKKRKFWN